MGNYNLNLNSGLNFFEASSFFQKAVRRGMEHEALWLATDFYMSGFGEYIWKRMRIIVSEDIGLANPSLPAVFESLYNTHLIFKKKKDDKHEPQRLQFIHAVLLLVRSPKSRLVDNKLCRYFFLRDTLESALELPDWVYDMHTSKGKKLGRGNEFFFEHSAVISNVPDALIDEEYKYRDLVQDLYAKQDAKEAAIRTAKLQARVANPLKDE